MDFIFHACGTSSLETINKRRYMKRQCIVLTALMITGLVSTPFARAESETAEHSTADHSTRSEKGSAHLNSDQKFIQEATLGGLMEVELGHLAQTHGGSQAVKDFGQKLIDDHGKANDELKQIAQKKGIVLSEIAGSKKGNDSSVDKHLAKLSGAEFDKAFASHMVKDHETDIKKFEHEASKGTDADVKAFAEKCLPTLREHLAAAKQLDTSKNTRASTVSEPAGASATVRHTSETSTTK